MSKEGKRGNLRKITEIDKIDADGNSVLAARFTAEYWDISYVICVNEEVIEHANNGNKLEWGKDQARQDPAYLEIKEAKYIDW